MQEVSHRVAAISGAMIVNTLVYSLSPPLTGDAAIIAHAADLPWHLHDFQVLWTNGSWLSALVSLAFLHKFTFYVAAILCSSAADEWEMTTDSQTGEKRRIFPHRTFTHSLVFFAILGVVCYIAYLYLTSLLTLPIWFEKEFWALVDGVLVTLMIHVVMDLFSHDGVQVLSPLSDLDVGILPQKARYRVGKPGESLFLWVLIFTSGMLFAAGIVGF